MLTGDDPANGFQICSFAEICAQLPNGIDDSGLTAKSLKENGRAIAIPLPRQIVDNPGNKNRTEWLVRSISRNGHRVILQGRPIGGRFGYDLVKKTWCSSNPDDLERGISEWTSARQGSFAHTSAVSFAGQDLLVHNPQGRTHVLLTQDGDLRFKYAGKHPDHRGAINLIRGGGRNRPWHRADHRGVTLLLDDSGLLHLTDAGGTLPALAIVLADGPTACWCSDGWVYGPPRFLGNQAPAALDQVKAILAAYMRRLS